MPMPAMLSLLFGDVLPLRPRTWLGRTMKAEEAAAALRRKLRRERGRNRSRAAGLRTPRSPSPQPSPLGGGRRACVDFVVDFAAGGFCAFDVVVDFYAVEGEADFVSDDGGFSGLPLVAGFGNEFVRRFEIVDGAVAIDGVSAAGVIAQDLDFVA